MADARVGTTPYWFRFLEWPPEQGGAAKPAQIDTWLYIFQVHDKGGPGQARHRDATRKVPSGRSESP